MTSDQLSEKLAAAGCCETSAGIIAVDTQKLIGSFIAAVKEIERLKNLITKPSVPGQPGERT
jgi:hypothetical protein